MGIYSYENERKAAVPASKLFKAMVLDMENVLHNALPGFKGCETEGDGGRGTIKKFHFHQGGVSKYVIHKIESIDEEKLSYKYSLIGGDLLKENVEKLDNEVTIVDSGDGGSLYKQKLTYHLKGDSEFQKEDLKQSGETTDGMFRAIEAYILSNPHY